MAASRAVTPYAAAPASAFWSRAVARGFDAASLVEDARKLLCLRDTIASAGSCFAANIVPHLERAGLRYLRTEAMHPMLRVRPEALGYDSFSAAYGNLYTARQLLQLLRRALGQWEPAERVWRDGETYVDPFRPGLRYRALSSQEFEALTQQHLAAVLRLFTQATVFVFTLGLTEAWVSKDDGAVFPACPGTVAGVFDPDRHAFVNFTVGEVVADLDAFIGLVRSINPALRIILTVSPVPLVATASGRHVLVSTTYSKSVLRAAAGDVSQAHDNVRYFPAYEIVTGPQAPASYFETDRRSVSRAGVAAVMRALLAHCETSGGPAKPASDPHRDLQVASRAIVQAQCEEEMSDPSRPRRPEPDALPRWRQFALRARAKARRTVQAATALVLSRLGMKPKDTP